MKSRKSPLKTLIFLAVAIAVAVAAIGRFFPLDYMDLIMKYSRKNQLAPALVCAVIKAESSFNPDAHSKENASGLMQLIQQTADWGGQELEIPNYSYDRIFDPELNIQLGTWYLNKLIAQFGDVNTALAAYNAGSGNVSGWLQDSKLSADGKTLDEIPFPETAAYLERVTGNQRFYSVILGLLGGFYE